MATLQELTSINGVVMACEFTADGKLQNFHANMEAPREMAEKAAQYIATVTMMFSTLADAFTKESQMRWTPQQFWTYTGGEWTVIAGGNQAVFAESNKTDINQVVRMLTGQAVQTSQVRQSM